MIEYTVLKLINGYDVLCSFDREQMTEATIKAIDPMTMITSMSPNGSSVVYLKRFNSLANENSISIRRNQIVATYVPRKELVSYYKLVVQYYNDIVDDMIVKELKHHSEIFDAALNPKSSEEFKKDIDKHFEEIFSEYEKEQMAKKKRSKVH